MRACALCSDRPAVDEFNQNLCDECGGELSVSVELMPEHIISSAEEGEAALVDGWGRPHYLDGPTPVGRVVGRPGLTILHSSVSREHASIDGDGERWTVADGGSTNGTQVGGKPAEGAELAHGDIVLFGSVGFYFISGTDDLQVGDDELAGVTVRPADKVASLQPPREDQTYTGLDTAIVKLSEPTGGGGGIFDVRGLEVQLTTTQFELISLLVARMNEEEHQPDLVRGFVRSSELLGAISWDTAHPSENHVKQLVRRVRRALTRAGIGNVIEARHRFGYRLRFIPAVASD